MLIRRRRAAPQELAERLFRLAVQADIFKLSGGVPVKYDIMISGNFQIYDAPGAGLFVVPPYFAANYVVNAANAGRTITSGQTSTGSINVNLLEPNKIFQQYYKIADVRFSKTMTVGKLRTTALAEFENLFNMGHQRGHSELRRKLAEACVDPARAERAVWSSNPSLGGS